MDKQSKNEQLLERYYKEKSIENRDAVISAFLPYAEMLARKFSNKGVEYDDLFQVASVSLFKALERFDFEKNIKFLSYAIPTMTGEIKNYFRDRMRLVRIPRTAQEQYRLINDARHELEQTLLRSPNYYEISEKTGIDFETVVELMTAGGSQLISIDSENQSDDSGEDYTVADFIGEDESGYENFEIRDTIEKALDTLEPDERLLVKRRFFDNISQRAAAAEIGVSQMTVSRMEKTILSKLRSVIELE